MTSKPKIEVGQKWRTRGGCVVTVTEIREGFVTDWPVMADNRVTYTLEGTEYKGAESTHDLVELVGTAVEEEYSTSPSPASVIEAVCDSLEALPDHKRKAALAYINTYFESKNHD